MRSRIGIVSLYDTSNIGNRLQNYALNSVLTSQGHDALSLETYPWRPTEYSRLDRLRDMGMRTSARLGAAAMRQLWASPNGPDLAGSARRRALVAFTQNHIPTRPGRIQSPGDCKELSQEFDSFIVGSDQVWNPEFTFCCPIYFLRFAPPEKRTLAYAASFGLDSIPRKAASLYTQWLSGLAHISVRERQGARIVRTLTGRTVPVVLDPTMLISAETWTSFAEGGPSFADRPFIALYLLTPPSAGAIRDIHRMGQENGLDILDILRPQSEGHSAHGVGAFLEAIRTASLVITDSFHATVFSILFERSFFVFRRGRMNSRIESLLHQFGLGGRAGSRLPDSLPDPPDFALSRERLPRERARSLSFLEEALQHDQTTQ